MRLHDDSDLTDEQLLAKAQASAERWEQRLANGGGHKGSDRPDRHPSSKSNGGLSRRRAYHFAKAHDDLWYIHIDGQRYKVASYAVPADWYGDDYGTGRHYSHILDQSYAYKSTGDHVGGRSGQAYRVDPTTGKRTTIGRKRGKTLWNAFIPYSAATASLFEDGSSGHVGMQIAE